LGRQAGSVYSLLPVVFYQEAARSMRCGLSRLQRQYQPSLRKLWKLHVLRRGNDLLQWEMRVPELRPAQLRRLWIRLPGGQCLPERFLLRVLGLWRWDLQRRVHESVVR